MCRCDKVVLHNLLLTWCYVMMLCYCHLTYLTYAVSLPVEYWPHTTCLHPAVSYTAISSCDKILLSIFLFQVFFSHTLPMINLLPESSLGLHWSAETCVYVLGIRIMLVVLFIVIACHCRNGCRASHVGGGLVEQCYVEMRWVRVRWWYWMANC